MCGINNHENFDRIKNKQKVLLYYKPPRKMSRQTIRIKHNLVNKSRHQRRGKKQKKKNQFKMYQAVQNVTLIKYHGLKDRDPEQKKNVQIIKHQVSPSPI